MGNGSGRQHWAAEAHALVPESLNPAPRYYCLLARSSAHQHISTRCYQRAGEHDASDQGDRPVAPLHLSAPFATSWARHGHGPS
jgi:hypothetical protein